MSKKVFSVISLLLVFVFITSITQPAYSSNEGKMRVWVEFSPGSAARVEKSLQSMGAEFHYRFEDLNSFVVTVPEQALAGLSRNPNVVSIEEDAIRYPAGQSIPYGIDLVQARDVWDVDRDNVVDEGAPTGSDIKVCIIDSGFYKGHEDLSELTVTGFNEGWDSDTCGHGTHVAGTIAASFNSLGVVGVTPGGAELYIVKVFDGPECGWSYSSTLANAAQQCQTAGANIISMSLGGAQKSKIEERAFNNLYSAGILSIAAAGNEGTSAYSYPASYSSVVSVAAIDETQAWADFSQFNNQVELAAPGVGVLSTVPFLNKASVTVDGTTYNGQPVEFAATGSAQGELVDGELCLAGDPTWSGKVVLCQRGDISFLDKVMNVQTSNGKAAVIYNNEPGDLLATLGEGYSSDIPAIGITQLDGEKLVLAESHLATVESSFTPDVSGYEAWDGTSMATPHVSGVAALVWSANPSWTNAKIREALTATAMDLGVGGRDNYYGYGLVQAKAALDYLGGGDPPPPPPPPTEDKIYVSISGAEGTYAIGESVSFTVKGQVDGIPVDGGSVTVIITNNRGKTVASLNEPTSSEGTATFNLTLTRKMGTGTFTITATVSKEGYIEGTATKDFLVK